MKNKGREALGMVIREAWVEWAKGQPNPKAEWIDQWDKLPENIKEVDRQLGVAVVQHIIGVVNPRRDLLIDKKIEGTSTTEELVELEFWQRFVFELVDFIVDSESNRQWFEDQLKGLPEHMRRQIIGG